MNIKVTSGPAIERAGDLAAIFFIGGAVKGDYGNLDSDREAEFKKLVLTEPLFETHELTLPLDKPETFKEKEKQIFSLVGYKEEIFIIGDLELVSDQFFDENGFKDKLLEWLL